MALHVENGQWVAGRRRSTPPKRMSRMQIARWVMRQFRGLRSEVLSRLVFWDLDEVVLKQLRFFELLLW